MAIGPNIFPNPATRRREPGTETRSLNKPAKPYDPTHAFSQLAAAIGTNVTNAYTGKLDQGGNLIDTGV